MKEVNPKLGLSTTLEDEIKHSVLQIKTLDFLLKMQNRNTRYIKKHFKNTLKIQDHI